MRGSLKTSILILFFNVIGIGGIISCKPISKDFIFYKTAVTIPIVVLPNSPKNIERKAAQLFIENFKLITGETIQSISESAAVKNEKSTYLFLGNTKAFQKINKNGNFESDGYAMIQEDNAIYLNGSNGIGVINAVVYFLEHYGGIKYIDVANKTFSQIQQISIPQQTQYYSTPAFTYREASYPAALDYNYALWNALHIKEEVWGCWGHNLHKLLNEQTKNSPSIYATINGKINKEQYCFSSNELYEGIATGIELKLAKNPDANYFSISANDNGLVCQCPICTGQNKGNQSASNSVCLLVKKLAERFPDAIISTLAYRTTLQAPSNIVLPKNTAILLSTIDFPKGQALKNSTSSAAFKKLVTNWKQVSSNCLVWDYPVQYTNYFDFFPTIAILQQDLQYFKEIGITGVFEQGSENDYSTWCDWKSFASAKLLWDPYTNLDSLRYSFFENAYPEQVDFLHDFLMQLEANLKKSKKNVDIYGTMFQSLNSYLTQEEFDLFYYELCDKYLTVSGKEKSRLTQLLTALVFNKLEMIRLGGLSAQGYATADGLGNRHLNTEINKLLTSLQQYAGQSKIYVYDEDGDSISQYVRQWNDFIINKDGKNLLYNKTITIQDTYDKDYHGDATHALNDGAIGFLDYATNWLLFNNKDMEVEIPIANIAAFKKLSLNFLCDVRHTFYYPEKVSVYGIGKNGVPTLLAEKTPTQIETSEKYKYTFTFDWAQKPAYEKIKIIAINKRNLSEQFYQPNKKATIACDEIVIQ